jgi:hypothetical protein
MKVHIENEELGENSSTSRKYFWEIQKLLTASEPLLIVVVMLQNKDL